MGRSSRVLLGGGGLRAQAHGSEAAVRGCVRLRVLLGHLASRVSLPVVKPSDKSSSQAPGGLSTDSHPPSAPPPLPSPRPGTFRSHGLLPGQTHPSTGLVSRRGGHGGGSPEPSSGAYLGSTGQRGPSRPRGPLGAPGLPCLLSRPPPTFSSQRFRPAPPQDSPPQPCSCLLTRPTSGSSSAML